MKTENDDSLHGRFFQLTHLYYRNTFKILSEIGIHPKQIPLLILLDKQDGMSQKEISKELHISAPTVAVSMKRMEKAGIIERRNDEHDQRMVRIYLTAQGREIIEKSRKCVEENEKLVFDGFSESEICLMKRFFDQMIQNLGGNDKHNCCM